jgi:hypothetical protein
MITSTTSATYLIDSGGDFGSAGSWHSSYDHHSSDPLAAFDRVGTLSARFKRDEPLLLGKQVGERGHASLEDALSGAAAIAQATDRTYAVRESQGEYVAHELLQPMWEKGFLKERVSGVGTSQLVPIEGGSAPRFGFFKFIDGGYYLDSSRRTGTVQLDPASGISAIVGGDWALVDGTVRGVEPRWPEHPRHPEPTDPLPPTRPSDPVDPPATDRGIVADVSESLRLAKEAARIIELLPSDDRGSESTKADRIKAFETNRGAQSRLERHFDDRDTELVSLLRVADASLEDANWQLAKKPSPDGRFNGVDVPGALTDTQRAVELLGALVGKLTNAAA